MTHETTDGPDIQTSAVAGEELKQFVERIERLEEEKKALADDIRDVYAELKGRGFDAKAVRQIIKIRKQDHAERKEMEAIVELYETSPGDGVMITIDPHSGTPSESPSAGTLKCPGVGRDKDCVSALQFYFSRRVTDEEMRFLHEVMQRSVVMFPLNGKKQ